jgi:DNA-binding MarR family transcriptional regulator
LLKALRRGAFGLRTRFLYNSRVNRKRDALKSKAERVARTCYVVRLRAFNRLISRIYNESLSAGKLTISQFNVLTAIVKREPVAPGQICSALHIEKSTISRNITLMRKNGWISAQAKGRILFLSTTAKGRAVYEDALPLWEQAQQKALRVAGEDIFQHIETTVRSLGKK